MLFILTLSLAPSSALPRVMRFGSSTMALSHSLATVDMRTGLLAGVSPGRQLLSFSRNARESTLNIFVPMLFYQSTPFSQF
jgi:hypothetical protein